MRRLLRWFGWSAASSLMVLLVIVIASLRGGDAALYPVPPGAPVVEVFVVANLHHSGLVLPRDALVAAAQRHQLAALTELAKQFPHQHLEFGWGDEGFYTRVPTTAELTVAIAIRALFRPGNPSVLHVVGVPVHPRVAYPAAGMVRLTLSEAGFDRLAPALDASFARSDGGMLLPLGRGLYGDSRFFRAVGTFHVMRVCNHWVADLLDAAGVPTAPALATLPQGLLWDLSWRAGAVRLPPPLR